MQETYAEPIYAKTPENSPRCHVPLIEFLFHLPWMMFQVTCPPRHLPWMPNQVSCSPPLTTEAGFLLIYVECWTRFLVCLFSCPPTLNMNKVSCPPTLNLNRLFTYLGYWTRFLAHPPWKLDRVSCPPTLNTHPLFLFTYFAFWTGFLFHLPWISYQVSCPPMNRGFPSTPTLILNLVFCPPITGADPGFLKTYLDTQPSSLFSNLCFWTF